MPRVTLLPRKIIINAERNESIYDVVRRNGIPLGSSCGGDGVCDKCRVTIVSGAASLSKINEIEARLILEHGFEKNERVACQTKILGNITITTGYW